MSKVREGYKETEIGVIPEDWEVIQLKELTSLITKGTTPTTVGHSFIEKGINFIKVENIDDYGRIHINGTPKISEECNNKLSRSIIQNNDILVSIAGTIGRSAIVQEKDLPANTNQALSIVRLKNLEQNDLNYINYTFSSKYFDSYIKSIKTVGAQPNMSLRQLQDYYLCIPPLPEQQRIAEILSTTDEHIEKLDKTIEDYQLLKKGMMRKLLTEGIGHTEFKDTEIGRIPKEWEVKKIGEIINLQGGYAFKSKEFSAYGVPIIRISNINNGFIDLRDCVYYPKELTINLDSFLLEEDDTVIAMSGATTGKVGIAPKNILPSYINQRVGRFSINDRKMIDKLFLYYYTNGFYFQEKIWDYAIGGAQPNISGVEIESIFIPIPSISEQKSIASIFKSIDNKIELYQNQQQDYIQLKKALMEQLLTGKIRTI